jgi:hypothetical protein
MNQLQSKAKDACRTVFSLRHPPETWIYSSYEISSWETNALWNDFEEKTGLSGFALMPETFINEH